MSKHRLLYAAGPGNIIAAHRHWRAGAHDPTEVSITFSSQIEDYCKRAGAVAYFISYRSPADLLNDGFITLEHRPKWSASKGWRFHWSELSYFWSLFRTALKFRATLAVIDSGTSQFFTGWMFRLVGIPVVVVLHNTIWPRGFPPKRPHHRLLSMIDAAFFRWGASATIGVSPECVRQVRQITNGVHGPLYEIRAQFLPSRFVPIAPPPAFDGKKLRVMYVGRVNRIKGVFDILEIARRLEQTHPGKVQWDICGTGPDFDLLQQRKSELALENVNLLGWVSLERLQQVYSDNHISIVPTRSDFAEGLAMTAAEAILANRPLITNPVVPALEVLREASLEARTDDVDSYVDVISRLFDDPAIYKRLCDACEPLQAQFYDRRNGIDAVLAKAIDDLS
ncbi:glycosyltransferase family 4 protein [Bradyrhizobium sp. CB3481]|uniref:glycosyltransferase family 4 protein n=1 Tax=Bradyrhizobium sp. CB3481 TaxID=3039158 RepID=UPI0024B195C5|nr:glycosyltransferase family 4 protein [Bradyrhizobium sp. CB3481]WFU18829.1 glycosyltransferase family 4 protein [Bradyrhizobium sp. CB3481]